MGLQMRVTQSADQFLAQLARAGEWERETHQRLLDEGWVWDDECRMYTHPDHPTTTISY